MLLWTRKYDHGTSDFRVYQNEKFDSFDKFNSQFNLHALYIIVLEAEEDTKCYTPSTNASVGNRCLIFDLKLILMIQIYGSFCMNHYIFSLESLSSSYLCPNFETE